ncbi:MAG: hypothetical protein HRT74_08115, partial [Flavobacteriales bacterium]|nr:hypothetical protein [Flavobacteriales bacterium]
MNFEADNTVEDGSCIFPGCADAPTNFTICYGENSTQTIILTEANAGEGVTLDILAGTTEAGFDTFNVYDGASNLAPLLFTAEGDLTGSVIQSTGADLTIEILSDGSVSCQSGAQTEISIDVYCAPVALGCTDATACNFDAAALTDDGSCEFTTCAGCTDSNATNFDPSATIDDGTCVTCAAGELLVTIDMVDTFGDGWNGNEYILSDGGGIISQNDLDNALIGDGTDFGQDLFCLAPGCYTLDVIEGGFPGEVQISVLDNLGNTYFTGGSPTAGQGLDIGTTGTCGFTGCTDPAAINFDINASVDDGSCILPPPNDTACTAEAIACGSSIIGNTTNSSDAEGLIGSNCSSIDVTSSGVWYEFNALADEQIFLSTCATTSGVDTKIHVYEAAPDCNNLVCVAANDDSPSCPAGSFLSEVVFNATTGTTYFVLVSEFGAGVGGEFNLDVICVDCTDGTPANDACENAAICISGVPTTQSICCANAAVQNDFGGFATTYDVWFVVNSGTFDNVAISAQTAGASNVGLTIYDGADCANLNSAAGGGPVTAEIAGNLSDFVTVVPNTDYLFQVWTTDPAGCGDITFVCEGQFLGCTDPSADNFDATATADDGSCTYTNIPANDECANAEVLVCNTTITGSTGGATTTGQPIGIVDCHAAPGTGVWYTFVGTGELHTLNTCGSIIDSKLNVYESDADCAGVLTCVGAAQDGLVACGFFDQDDTELSFTSTAGLNYYVYVSSEGAEGLFDLSFTCETIVEGCTNPVACDFDPAANVDTGCDFFSCACDLNPTGFGLQVNMVTTFGNGWNGATYEIFDGAGVSITSGDLDNADFSEDVDNVEGPDSGFDIICLDAGCYSIVVGGAGFLDFANSFSIADENGVEIAAGGSETVL